MTRLTHCSVEGCEKTGRIKRTWCEMHYKRWTKFGDVHGGGRRYETPEEAFTARTETGDNGCLLWVGAKGKYGYGNLNVDGYTEVTHKYAWERTHGKVPADKFLDHRCHNRLCVSLDHLRLVDNKENSENRSGARKGSKSGIRGVSWHKQSGKWKSSVCHNYKHYFLGLYEDPVEAGEVARLKRLELFTHNDKDRD